MDRKPKMVFQLDTPYSEVSWPTISPKDQETILDLLTSLLSPIGHHRTVYGIPSKGKRSKKRKRQESKNKGITAMSEENNATPPAPEFSSHIMVGLSSISRYLEMLCHSQRAKSRGPEPGKVPAPVAAENEEIDKEDDREVRNLAVVFVCRSSQPSVLHAHLPQLIATASLGSPLLPPMRLVQLPQGCESRLSSSLGLPRASFIGLFEDAQHFKPLIELVRERVPAIEVSWLKESKSAQYKPVKINHIYTTVPIIKSNGKKN